MSKRKEITETSKHNQKQTEGKMKTKKLRELERFEDYVVIDWNRWEYYDSTQKAWRYSDATPVLVSANGDLWEIVPIEVSQGDISNNCEYRLVNKENINKQKQTGEKMKTRAEYLSEINGEENKINVALMLDEIEDVVREALLIADDESKKLLTKLTDSLL